MFVKHWARFWFARLSFPRLLLFYMYILYIGYQVWHLKPSVILLSHVHRLLSAINSAKENSKRRLYAAVTLSFVLYDIRWLTSYCSVTALGCKFTYNISSHCRGHHQWVPVSLGDIPSSAGLGLLCNFLTFIQVR